MTFDVIEGLSEKEIEGLYEDILQFEENTLLTMCQCCNGANLDGRPGDPYGLSYCESWCRNKGGCRAFQASWAWYWTNTGRC